MLQGEKKVIGAPLVSLLEGQKVPPMVERLIQTIEQNGLYTTGLYRKAGAAARIRDMVHLMNSGEGRFTGRLSCQAVTGLSSTVCTLLYVL